MPIRASGPLRMLLGFLASFATVISKILKCKRTSSVLVVQSSVIEFTTSADKDKSYINATDGA